MLSVHNIAAARDNDCFEHWHRGHLPELFRHRISPAGDRPVHRPDSGATVWRATVSDVSSSFSDWGIEVTRSSVEIRKDPRDHFMLYLVCRGEVGIDQDGRAARIGAGDLVIYDQSQPFTLEFGGYSRGIVLTIPRPLMVSPLADVASFDRPPDRRRIKARHADGDNRAPDRSNSMPVGEEVANRVSASALDILATTLEVELAGMTDGAAGRQRRLDQVKRYVLANLDDADMTIETHRVGA